ncbi:MAG TPA: peptidoglycan DD-metalloendopeptidase family protein [Sphingomicrobium sp.]|nr:peptidoglycan DD-metalloendopeptidase family protein [Sphingomicrobium sp.]
MFRLASTVLLAAGSAAIAASAPVRPEQLPLDLQLQQARSEANAAVAEQRRLEKAAAEARDEVTRLRARQLAAAQAIAAAEARISAADARARLAAAQVAAQRQRLAQEQAPASALLGGLALTARRPPLLLLADSGSADEIVKLRILVAATAPAIRAKTAALSREFDNARRLEKAAIAARDSLQRSRGELHRRRAEFAALEQRALQVARRRGSQALGAGDLALVRQERLAIAEQGTSSKQASASLARELAELGPAPVAATGSPQAAPLRYRLPANALVSDGLGGISANGVRSRGMTLATQRGTTLAAPASGTILFAGPFRDYDGVVIIDHGGGWKSVLVNAGSKLPKGAAVRMGDPFAIAFGPVEVQLQRNGEAVSPALIAGSSAKVSNPRKGG